MFGSSWLLKAQFARHHELETYGGAGATTPLLGRSTVNPNLRTGGFGGYEDHDFTRAGYRADLTRYLGGHTIKGGFDYMKVDSLDLRYLRRRRPDDHQARQRAARSITSTATT